MITANYLFSNEFNTFETELKKLSFDTKIYKKGDTIISLADKRNILYYSIKGIAIFNIIHRSGHSKISTFRGEGTIFPLYVNTDQTVMESFIEVKAFTDITVLQIYKIDIYKLMMTNIDFSMAMNGAYSKYTTLLLYDLTSQLFDNAIVKTCNFLYIYVSSMNPVVPLVVELTQEEIGDIIGLTRSNVSRALNELKKEKIIQTDRNLIRVTDLKKLKSYCSDFMNL